MAGSFNSKTSEQATIFTLIHGVSKKTFLVALFLYYIGITLTYFNVSIIDTFFDSTLLLGIVLASFIFTLTFTQNEEKKSRISRSDWALIGLFAVIALGLNVVATNDYGIGGLLGSIILLLFAFGLILYIWSGNDDGVKFSLFGRDRRYKFATYLRSSMKEWVLSIVIILLILTINFIFAHSDQTPAVTPDIPTPSPTSIESPTPTITEEPVTPTLSPVPTNEPTPTPSPIPVSALPAEYNVYVLNGSGTPGAASEIKTLLETNGITVRYAGDASTFDYSETLIKYNDGFETLADAIYQTLIDTYPNAKTESFVPNERYSQYNVVVIHGE